MKLLKEIREVAIENNNVFIVHTHGGPCHLDEGMSLAVIAFICRRAGVTMDLIRSRDVYGSPAHMFLDVGLEYDSASMKFDHHQGNVGRRTPRNLPGGEKRDGYSFSSIGLIWKHYGREFVELVLEDCTDIKLAEMQVNAVVDHVDRILIEGICAADTGEYRPVVSNDVLIQSLAMAFSRLNPVWIESKQGSVSDSEKQTRALSKALPFLSDVLMGYVLQAAEFQYTKGHVIQEIRNTSNGILVLDTPIQTWRGLVGTNRNIKFVIQPQIGEDRIWAIHAIPADSKDTERYRCPFPTKLSGSTGASIKLHTGIKGVTFVHSAGFLAVATSKISAIKYATHAIEMSHPEKTKVTV